MFLSFLKGGPEKLYADVNGLSVVFGARIRYEFWSLVIYPLQRRSLVSTTSRNLLAHNGKQTIANQWNRYSTITQGIYIFHCAAHKWFCST